MSEIVSTARRRELGAELRRIREGCGYNGIDMALRLNWAPSMVSRAETGKRPMTRIEVATYTALCGVAGQRLTGLLGLADEPDDNRLKSHGDLVADALRTLVFHEQTAVEIESFQPIYIPGVAQTEDYARAVFEGTGIIKPADIENFVQIRVARRDVITRFRPAQCTFYVHENVLRTPIGSPQVMHEQMLHLLFLDTRPQCSIRVVPVTAGSRGTAAGSFQIFGYTEGAPVVCVQHESTSEFLENGHHLASYRSVLRRLASVALDEASSRAMIALVASDYERQGVAGYERGAGERAGLAQEQL
ncbi:MAG TPA: helix-turn-helix transcriptional regulator [Pseudonocardiaceae bacterium]|nr:helix-turn-helix transcriptional regulator [Pseudonocardiaceae bacterium]